MSPVLFNRVNTAWFLQSIGSQTRYSLEESVQDEGEIDSRGARNKRMSRTKDVEENRMAQSMCSVLIFPFSPPSLLLSLPFFFLLSLVSFLLLFFFFK